MAENGTAAVTPAVSKRPKKLNKEIAGTVIKIGAVGGSKGTAEYDFGTLPKDIRDKLGPFGLAHKLGDAAAGKTGSEAEESIQKVWEGLVSGDWSVRAPATPKVSVKALVDKMSKLPPKAQAAARELLKSLGIDVPA